MNRVNSWLSQAGLVDNMGSNDDTDNNALHRVPSSISLGIPSELLEAIETCINEDDDCALRQAIKRVDYVSDIFLSKLLQRAVAGKSYKCMEVLLEFVDISSDGEDLNRRKFLHRHIIGIGKEHSPTKATSEVADSDEFLYIRPATTPMLSSTQAILEDDSEGDDDRINILKFLLEHLRPSQRPAITAKDNLLRTPLHYAARAGLPLICSLLLHYISFWNLAIPSNGYESPEWLDNDNLSPLDEAVMAGHTKTVVALISTNKEELSDSSKPLLLCHKALKSAVKANMHTIVALLVNAEVDLNHQSTDGETAVHVACLFNAVDSLKILLNGTDIQRVDTELVENTYGWTPLFVAAVEGHVEAVSLLLGAGCDFEKTDYSGWTAMEHATLRGHLDVAKTIAENVAQAEDGVTQEDSSSSSSVPGSPAVDAFRLPQVPVKSTMEPVKSFGHRYLVGKAMIVVTLGSADVRKNVSPVQLDQVPLANVHSTQLDTALSLVVSASGASGDANIIDLPTEQESNEPIVFLTDDVSKAKLFFDIVPTYSGNDRHILGRAVAMLDSVRSAIGPSRSSLEQNVSIPILQINTLDVIGMVRFEFLIVLPFEHPKMAVHKSLTYWKSFTTTRVIGHRGMGMNVPARKSLQLGENTMQSFIAAANLGASYVEFDVQLTKDRVPVIYHDFLVGETGIDAPVHALTLEQFMSASERQVRPSRPSSPVRKWNGDAYNKSTIVDGCANGKERGRRARSASLTGANTEIDDVNDSMRFTRGFKLKGYKGNARGSFIQGPFTTLAEVFQTLPKGVGFNIECKYPMLDESEKEDMENVAFELNSYVDTILSTVYDHANGRDIIFSSFHPDVCLMLSMKQPSIPILFLTDGGTQFMADVRASSLQQAIRFASRWNLLGIVSACEPLILCPRLVRVVKESGLVCVSYGAMNNEPSNVKRQVKNGVDAVIVDSILAVRQGLTLDS